MLVLLAFSMMRTLLERFVVNYGVYAFIVSKAASRSALA